MNNAEKLLAGERVVLGEGESLRDVAYDAAAEQLVYFRNDVESSREKMDAATVKAVFDPPYVAHYTEKDAEPAALVDLPVPDAVVETAVEPVAVVYWGKDNEETAPVTVDLSQGMSVAVEAASVAIEVDKAAEAKAAKKAERESKAAAKAAAHAAAEKAAADKALADVQAAADAEARKAAVEKADAALAEVQAKIDAEASASTKPAKGLSRLWKKKEKK